VKKIVDVIPYNVDLQCVLGDYKETVIFDSLRETIIQSHRKLREHMETAHTFNIIDVEFDVPRYRNNPKSDIGIGQFYANEEWSIDLLPMIQAGDFEAAGIPRTALGLFLRYIKFDTDVVLAPAPILDYHFSSYISGLSGLFPVPTKEPFLSSIWYFCQGYVNQMTAFRFADDWQCLLVAKGGKVTDPADLQRSLELNVRFIGQSVSVSLKDCVDFQHARLELGTYIPYIP